MRIIRHRERYLRGRWVGFEGLVYPKFDIRKHVISSFKIPPEWEKSWSIDFGYTAPFCAQLWAKDPLEDKYYLVKEIYHTKRTVAEHWKTMKKYCKLFDCFQAVADHDAEGIATLERDCFYEDDKGRRRSIKCVPANKNKSDGIQLVNNMIASDQIFIFEDALIEKDISLTLGQVEKPFCTAQEFGFYRWKENKEEPIDSEDHGQDAMRYAMMTPWKIHNRCGIW